ncbi:MAG: response regulator transcription factor [Thermoleophilia bacterium]|nr:response regulator transcription factor [Thermoleophilia bacterium]
MGVARVLVADDHRLMLAGIKRALAASDEVEVVGEASAGSQVLPAINRTRPDVVLLDVRMPDVDGLTCLARIRKQYPEVKVVMLSAGAEPETVDEARRLGASAYAVKTITPLDLPAIVNAVLEGAEFAVHGAPERSSERTAAEGLSERELAVLRALARGLSNKEIARELWVTEQTVKFHLRNIYRKLELANRTEAARYAYRHGLVDAPPGEQRAAQP